MNYDIEKVLDMAVVCLLLAFVDRRRTPKLEEIDAIERVALANGAMNDEVTQDIRRLRVLYELRT